MIQEEHEKSCEWERIDICLNKWRCSACGFDIRFLSDGPKKNGMNFCPKCGRSIVGENIGRFGK